MDAVVVHVAPELRFFLSARHRHAVAIPVPFDGTASVGHLVESLGIPLPEVGAIEVDGRGVRPGHRPAGGARVAVAPVARPQPAPTSPPRFVLDVHLGSLARRLRLLGVDADWAADRDDDHLVARAAEQRRVLLTKDRGLLRRRSVRHGAFVRGDGADRELADVLDRFAPPLAPYTRCVACNGVLAEVAKDDVWDRLEPGTRRCYDSFTRCSACGRVYWHGAHAARLDALVRAVAGDRAPPRAAAP